MDKLMKIKLGMFVFYALVFIVVFGITHGVGGIGETDAYINALRNSMPESNYSIGMFLESIDTW